MGYGKRRNTQSINVKNFDSLESRLVSHLFLYKLHRIRKQFCTKTVKPFLEYDFKIQRNLASLRQKRKTEGQRAREEKHQITNTFSILDGTAGRMNLTPRFFMMSPNFSATCWSNPLSKIDRTATCEKTKFEHNTQAFWGKMPF